MMQRILIAGMAALAVVAGACQTAPQPAPSGPPAFGSYTFRERIAADSGAPAAEIAGEVLILPDTMRLETEAGPCRYIPPTIPDPHKGMSYSCPGFGIMLDGEDPVHRSRYSIMLTGTKNTTVCVRYVTDSMGRQTCAETVIQPIERSVTRTGYLHLHPKGG